MHLPEEMFGTTVANRGWRRRTSTGRQACTRWHHRQIARHHARSAQLLTGRGNGMHLTGTEVARVHRRHSAENVVVVKVVDVREASSAMQRREAAEAIESATESDDAEAPAISTPPRVEIVARPDREPAEAAPTAVAKSETKAAAPSPKRDIGRRPERT